MESEKSMNISIHIIMSTLSQPNARRRIAVRPNMVLQRERDNVGGDTSIFVAYVLWWFGGAFQLHHWYLGRDNQACLPPPPPRVTAEWTTT